VDQRLQHIGKDMIARDLGQQDMEVSGDSVNTRIDSIECILLFAEMLTQLLKVHGRRAATGASNNHAFEA
jgi:hypothetical protein